MPAGECRFASAVIVLLAFGGLLATATPGAGGVNRWTRTGPEGANLSRVLPVAGNPLTAYAQSWDGIYVTHDGGATWSWPSPAEPTPMYRLLAVHPADDNTVFASGPDGSLLRSDDGVVSWTELAAAPSFHSTRAWLAISQSPVTLWAAGSGDVLRRSRDDGESWVTLELPPNGQQGWSGFAVHPRQPDLVYAAAEYVGLWRSDNGGADWSRCAPLLPAFEPPVYHILLHPSDRKRLWVIAGITVPTSGRTIYESRDRCRSWEQLPARAGANYFSRAVVDATEPATIYLYSPESPAVSRDGGRTWEAFGPDLDPAWVADLAQSPADPDRLWLASSAGATPNGVAASTDRGATWSVSMIGMRDASVGPLIRVGAGPQTVLARIDATADPSRSLFLSSDGGRRWSPIAGTRGLGSFLAVAPSTPWVVYAAMLEDGSLYRSDDAGRTWRELGFVAEDVWWRDLVVDAFDPDVVYAQFESKSNSADMLFRSHDGGGTWFELPGPDGAGIVSLAADPHRPGVLWAATWYGAWRSPDRGDSWVQRSEHLGWRPNPLWGDPGGTWSLRGIDVDPFDPNVVLGYRCDGVWRSDDAGGTWWRSRTGLIICSYDDDLVSPECSGLKVADWAPVQCQGGPTDLSFDPYRSGIVYASTEFGTYRSDDSGRTWHHLGAGWGLEPIGQIVAADDGRLLAGTRTNGLLEYQMVGQGATESTVGADE